MRSRNVGYSVLWGTVIALGHDDGELGGPAENPMREYGSPGREGAVAPDDGFYHR
jgi:hypothetical protein